MVDGGNFDWEANAARFPTLNTPDAEDLIGLAIRKGLKVTAGHNAQARHQNRSGD